MAESKASGKVIVHERENSETSYFYNGGALAFYAKKMQHIDGELCVTELLTDFWSHISWAGIAKEGGVKLKNGKKPEKLIKQIIELSTEKNEIVLDFFLGCGTTAAVAHKMGRQYIGLEQLDYGNNDATIRLTNVVKGDQTGISTAVHWHGGGDFVYFELKRSNKKFIEDIEAAPTTEQLLEIWEQMKQRAFFRFSLDMQQFDENIEQFKLLSLDEQKNALCRVLDLNQLYVNRADINDEELNVSDEEKRITNDFYKQINIGDMAFLFDDYTTASKFGAISKTLPKFIVDNLRPKFVLRPYQVEAFARFVYFYEKDEREDKQNRPYHLLFNMATGSGKTNIMAGLMLYLFAKGYRDFLFFVNSNTIIEKTKENFLNPASSKYVFNEIITFDAQEVVVKEVQSFDESDPDNINVKFTTIQQLHLDMENPKENSISLEDFKNRRIVLLADEADNFNVATRSQLTTEGNWEQTIQAIHSQNIDNILLEFTATMDLETPEIEAKYKDKAIFKYELKEFRRDRYSKEIELLRVSSGAKGRVLHALILNLYRQVLAAHHHINLKPVILFKAKKTIAESARNKALFHQWIDELTVSDIDALRKASDIDIVIKQAFAYFDDCGITSTEIVKRTQENFKSENCISANNDAEKEKNQLLLNSLEDENNPIRAVFAVNKLDRGWDVLNLFDIVRMYDDRNEESRGQIGKTTRAEAQLIGRGARFFPFQITPDQELFMRKYDSDQANPLRILETLYYHIIGDSRYVAEIKKALVEVGMGDETSVTKVLRLKDEFKKTEFFRTARVVFNKKVPKSYSGVNSLTDLQVKKINMVFSLSELHSQSVNAFDEAEIKSVAIKSRDIALANIPYHVIRYALTTIPFYRFDNLTKYCPNLKSMRNFIEDKEYLGEYEITFKGSKERINNITNNDYLHAVQQLLTAIENEIKSHVVESEGSDFFYEYLHRIFTDKQITFPKDPEREEGQITFLADKDWYAYNANYGTSEERAFIELFARRYEIFSMKYEDIYIIRNEKVVKIVNKLGQAFEPDFLLYLRKKDDKQMVYQVFIEPKGAHLKGKDKWKEDFLKDIRSDNMVFKIDTDTYYITGVPFYNQGDENEFKKELETMLGCV